MVEQLLQELTAAVRELTLAVRENTAARRPAAPTPTATEPTPLERLRAAIAQVKTERQALNLWDKASPTLTDAERPVAWGELVARFNQINNRRDGDGVLRAALAAAAPSKAPAPAARTTGRAR